MCLMQRRRTSNTGWNSSSSNSTLGTTRSETTFSEKFSRHVGHTVPSYRLSEATVFHASSCHEMSKAEHVDESTREMHRFSHVFPSCHRLAHFQPCTEGCLSQLLRARTCAHRSPLGSADH